MIEFTITKAGPLVLVTSQLTWREMSELVPCSVCGANIGETCVMVRGKLKGERASAPHEARLSAGIREHDRQREDFCKTD